MSPRPILLVLSVILVLVSQTLTESPNDLVVGAREPGDFLAREYRFAREATSKRIIAFRPFDVADEHTITQVRALDRTNGTGGRVTHEYGGPGMTRVLLGFHSKVNQGIDYDIELYGKLYKP